MNGQCARGCASGWKGYTCDKGSLNNATIHVALKIQTYNIIFVSDIIYPTLIIFKDQLHLYEKSLSIYIDIFANLFKGVILMHIYVQRKRSTPTKVSL